MWHGAISETFRRERISWPRGTPDAAQRIPGCPVPSVELSARGDAERGRGGPVATAKFGASKPENRGRGLAQELAGGEVRGKGAGEQANGECA